MRITNTGDIDFQLEASWEEVRILHQVLNEVCNGLRIENFEKTIGDMDAAKIEMSNLRALYADSNARKDSRRISIHMTPSLIEICRNALARVQMEIDDWDFETRLGASKQQVQSMLDVFHKALA